MQPSSKHLPNDMWLLLLYQLITTSYQSTIYELHTLLGLLGGLAVWGDV